MPPEIADVYLDFDWDKRDVWALEVESELVDRRILDWHLDLPFWSTRPPAPLFDLTPRRVVESPASHAVHARRIDRADLNCPLDVMEHRGRVCIMDGIHRLAKALLVGKDRISVRRIPRSALPAVWVAGGSSNLPGTRPA
jgi:hypothetical protein